MFNQELGNLRIDSVRTRMGTNLHESFIQLVRLGIGAEMASGYTLQDSIDWAEIKALAEKQGLSAIVLDGVEKLPDQQRPPRVFLLKWIGEVLQDESNTSVQQKNAGDMALLFHGSHIRTYVLKGAVVAECYPKPEHRASVDMDCYLLGYKVQGTRFKIEDVWEKGNKLIEEQGYEVKRDFYKNSTFYLPGLTVENHKYFTPFRGNKKLSHLEVMLQGMMKEDKDEDKFEGVWLYRPPVMVTALFLIEHAYSHFLHEGLTWRHVLDWMMFSKKHKKEIDWYSLDAMIDEFGFRKFYDSYYRLGQYLLGEMNEESLRNQDKRMLGDIWNELDLHETVKGIKGKLALVGNTLRARWKYHYFSEDSMTKALWIQVKGVLFDKNPQLN